MEEQEKEIYFCKCWEYQETLEVSSCALGWDNEKAKELYFRTWKMCPGTLWREVKGGDPKAFQPLNTLVSILPTSNFLHLNYLLAFLTTPSAESLERVSSSVPYQPLALHTFSYLPQGWGPIK